MSNPNAVVAKLHNQASYEEGEAVSDLEPGQGCVLYEEDGEKYVRSAEADEQTTRVVREARNPPRGLGEPGESPLTQTYNGGEWVETIGFNSNDQARMHLADGGDGDDVGYNADGHLATIGGETGGENAVARVRETYDVDGADFGTVEFL
jgi:hypothetical protein